MLAARGGGIGEGERGSSMKRLRRRGLIGALACVALVLAGAASALADFPYTPGAGTNAHDYSTYHTDAGQAPNDFGDDWRLAATPENSAQSTSSDNWKPTELCGIRGASVVDNSATYSSLLWPPSPMTSCQSLGGQPVHTAWQTTTGRPDVAIAVLDSGILWNDASKMVDLRNKVRLNTGELPLPEVAATSTDSSLASSCAGYDKAGNGGATDPNTGAHTSSKYDANDDGIVNLADYACDPRVHVASGPTSPRHGPNGTMTPEDLIIAFGNCQIDSSTHLILGCTPGQHFDNDHNAFANDIAGWDFVDNKNNPYDDVQYGHGSGEARDSTAEANNGSTTNVGTCPNCMVLPLRVGESFIADVNRFAQAVLYATDTQPQPGGQQSGVYVVQEALGTLNNSTLARDALAYAYNHGVAVIASAADEAAEHHNQPGALPHAIVVNAIEGPSDIEGVPVTNELPSYLQIDGCTNFGTRIDLSVPATSCSSEATGKSAGVAGLVYSAALNACGAPLYGQCASAAGHKLAAAKDCTRVDGTACAITANEVHQLFASGNIAGTTVNGSSTLGSNQPSAGSAPADAGEGGQA